MVQPFHFIKNFVEWIERERRDDERAYKPEWGDCDRNKTRTTFIFMSVGFILFGFIRKKYFKVWTVLWSPNGDPYNDFPVCKSQTIIVFLSSIPPNDDK